MKLVKISFCGAVFGVGALIADGARFFPGPWRVVAALVAIALVWGGLMLLGVFFDPDTTDRDRRLRQ